LIQDQGPTRNIDSKSPLSGFDCCLFLLASYSLSSFATQSARNGRSGLTDRFPELVEDRNKIARNELPAFDPTETWTPSGFISDQLLYAHLGRYRSVTEREATSKHNCWISSGTTGGTKGWLTAFFEAP
jgi:hypothetical protein